MVSSSLSTNTGPYNKLYKTLVWGGDRRIEYLYFLLLKNSAKNRHVCIHLDCHLKAKPVNMCNTWVESFKCCKPYQLLGRGM